MLAIMVRKSDGPVHLTEEEGYIGNIEVTSVGMEGDELMITVEVRLDSDSQMTVLKNEQEMPVIDGKTEMKLGRLKDRVSFADSVDGAPLGFFRFMELRTSHGGSVVLGFNMNTSINVLRDTVWKGREKIRQPVSESFWDKRPQA